MKTFTVQEAKDNFDEVLKHAAQGETVFIVGDDRQAFELVATVVPEKGPRKAGRLKGKIKITDEFYEPLPEFEPYSK